MTTARDAWTRPGIHAVAGGVHRIVCPLPGDGLQAINVYAIEDGDGVALLDTGSNHPDAIAALEDGLRSLGSSLEGVTTIICTHSHYDHYGLAGAIRARSGAPVVLGTEEIGNLDSALERETFERAGREQRQAMVEHGAQALLDEGRSPTFEEVQTRGPWERPDRWLADGERVELRERVLEAILTPGHTRGHLMFRDAATGLVFGGDHLLPHITPSLGFESFNDGKALERFLASLAAIRDLEAPWVLPGHGPVFSDLRGRVEELEAHHAARLEACLGALDGPAPAFVVAQRLTWTRHERVFDTLDRFNRMLATMETVTHLELLADRGELRRERAGELLRYARA
jgi:glyoxylase-like metal-dependent hydrolase (beta-lactamase superfamily II)